MSVDWYDKCQTVEAELLLLRAEIERLRAAAKQGNSKQERGNLDGLITALQLIAHQKGEHWSKGVARRALEGK